VSSREEIRMSDAELDAFLHEQRTVICATIDRDGAPHLMPLWYLVRDRELWAWTYAASQKVRNLERDPRATLQVEDGEEYHELRGVMIEARTEIHRETERVAELGIELFQRYGTEATGSDFVDAVRAQAVKRVALQFVPARIASWDHGKLGGIY
jgi:PPOX class probable F420-dependent enzyme